MSELDKGICSIHQMYTIAIDFDLQTPEEKRELCAKCLTSNRPALLNNEFNSVIIDLKLKKHQQEKQIYESQLENYQQLSQKLQDFSKLINGFINKILSQINIQIEKIKNNISNISAPQDKVTKEDLLLLIQSQFEEKTITTTSISQRNLENEREFIISIKDQLQRMQFDEPYNEIINLVLKISNHKQSKEEVQQKVIKTENNPQPHKTPFLKYNCSNHGKEIVIFTLDENCQDDRLLCIDCIPNFNHKLITLEEVDKIWMNHQGKIFDSHSALFNERKSKQKQILDIIGKYQESHKQQMSNLLKDIQTQDAIIENELFDLEQNKEKKSLLQLELNTIKQTLNILAQKDQMHQHKLLQLQQLNQDSKHYQEILSKFDELNQLEKAVKNKLNCVFDLNEQIGGDVQLAIEQAKKELKELGLEEKLFSIVIPKLQNELLPNLLELWKQISDKCLQYIEQLKSIEQEKQDQESAQTSVYKYQEILVKFERQYKILMNKLDIKDGQTQTTKVLNTQFKLINIPPKILKPISLTVNSLFQDKYLKPFNSKLLKFSTTLKHQSITISADGKTAQSTSGWYLCLCDQAIPKNGTVVVDFKVKQIQNIMAGICLKDSYNKDYTNSYSNGQGCYFLQFNGYVWSHHDSNKNGVSGGFSFQQNDIISMVVNVQSKQISWRNKAKNHVYSMDIQTTSDLYFCFNLANSNNEIELV